MPPEPRHASAQFRAGADTRITTGISQKKGLDSVNGPIEDINGASSKFEENPQVKDGRSSFPNNQNSNSLNGQYRSTQNPQAMSNYGGASGYGGMSGYGMSGYGMSGLGYGMGGMGMGMMGGYGMGLGGFGMPYNNGMTGIMTTLYSANHILMSFGQLVQIIGGNSQQIMMQIGNIRQFISGVCQHLRNPALEKWIRQSVRRYRVFRWILIACSMALSAQVMHLMRSYFFSHGSVAARGILTSAASTSNPWSNPSTSLYTPQHSSFPFSSLSTGLPVSDMTSSQPVSGLESSWRSSSLS
mmetsp:Transcript_37087/g.37764  ORF Transcript_37087/g.37764 Transcript_37087/m.37764 type:complete len:299 (+) Transcript_37087:132-1028(+)